MDMALPKGIPTHIHNVMKKWSRLDNVFATEHTLRTITTCNTLPGEQGINTDHLPIVMVLDMELIKAPKKTLRNFKEVNWKSFMEALKNKLSLLGIHKRIHMQGFLNYECDNLTKAIQDTIKSEVPITDINAKSKRWWTKELKLTRRETDKVGRKAFKYRCWLEHPIHTELIAAHKKYSKDIQHVKQHHWRDWLKKASDLDIWTVHKYISAPASD
ncbi:hypothetical protein EDB87DRAFT_1549170, partial [Lactarius vividus]